MNNYVTLITDPLTEVYFRFRAFFPNLVAMLVIIVIGIIIAWLAKLIVVKALQTIKFDIWSDRMGFTLLIRRSDVWAKPSITLGKIVYWLVLIGFVMVGLSALHIPVIDNIVEQFFLYIPRAVSAVVIMLIGYLIAGFLSRAVLLAAVNMGLYYSKVLSEAVRILLSVLILAMALEQLQVAPNIVLAAFSIMFGGIIISLSISFGVGGINAARKIIEKGNEDEEEKKKNNVVHL